MIQTLPTQLSAAQLAAGPGGAELDGVAIAILSSYFLQWAKTSRVAFFAWVSPENARLISALVAVLAAAGITASYQIDGGVLTVTGLTPHGVAQFVWLASKQFIVQDLAFRLGFKLPDAVRDLGRSDRLTNVINSIQAPREEPKP